MQDIQGAVQVRLRMPGTQIFRDSQRFHQVQGPYSPESRCNIRLEGSQSLGFLSGGNALIAVSLETPGLKVQAIFKLELHQGGKSYAWLQFPKKRHCRCRVVLFAIDGAQK